MRLGLGGCHPLAAGDVSLFRGLFLLKIVLGEEILHDARLHVLEVLQTLPRSFDVVKSRSELLPNNLEDNRPIPFCLLDDVLDLEVDILASISEV
jgi:hypothetical protein